MRMESSVFAFWTAVATDPSNHGPATKGELVSSVDMSILYLRDGVCCTVFLEFFPAQC